MSERIGAATEVSRALTKDLKRLKPQEEKESGFKQRTLDTQEPKHLRISGSTCFKLLDVGLSKLCPKANSQLRFARGLQVKTDILHTKVIRGKVVEEIELIHVHCFTTQDFAIKPIKIKDSLSQPFKTNLFQNHSRFWYKFKVFECHWLVSRQNWHQPLKFKF